MCSFWNTEVKFPQQHFLRNFVPSYEISLHVSKFHLSTFLDINTKWKKYLNVWKFNLHLLQGFMLPCIKITKFMYHLTALQVSGMSKNDSNTVLMLTKNIKKFHFITIMLHTLPRHIGIQQKNNFQKRWSYGREWHQKPKPKFSIILLWVVTHLKPHLQILPYWKISNFSLEAYFLDLIFLLDT